MSKPSPHVYGRWDLRPKNFASANPVTRSSLSNTMSTTYTPSEPIARKIVETIKCGLSSGLGKPEPGKMCVEAAVRYAFGLPHSDDPPCVGAAVRSFEIRLNDCRWSSEQARAAGMLRLGVAQLGSNQIDQQKFAELLCIKTVNRIVPPALRVAAKVNPEHAEALEAAAVACEAAKTLVAAKEAAESGRRVARAADDAAAYACASAADTAASAADTAAAYACAAYAAAAADARRDGFLLIAAEIGLECLKELNSPGCQWLHLCD
jgi:hypothetical protein